MLKPDKVTTIPLLTLMLQAYTAPASAQRQCQHDSSRPDTVYTEGQDGVTWTVTFDLPTSQSLRSQLEQGLQPLVELDCLLNKELHEKCPRWIHEEGKIAIELDDGRLRASGRCAPNSSDAVT